MLDRLSKVFTDFGNNSQLIFPIILLIVVLSVAYFFMLKFLYDNNSAFLISIFTVTMLVIGLIVACVDKLNSVIFLLVPILFIIIVISIYSTEIKRLIWNKKTNKSSDLKKAGVSLDKETVQNCINALIRSLQNMSKNDIGAIIVLTSGNFPTQIIDSGVALDSDISSELIESVFFPKTPLHDGAMIINGTKIVAAGCFLPLTQKMDNIPKELGSRHRAGIGVTETIDVVSIIVSEETGIISIAKGGKITRYADTEMLKKTLTKYYWQEFESAKR